MPILINKAIDISEKKLSLYKFIFEKFPDTKVYEGNGFNGFSSKAVNSTYTDFEFVRGHHSIWVVPYLELDFNYQGNCEKVRVNSYPRANKLVYVKFDYSQREHTIKFSRLNINLKNNKFKDDMLNACRSEILDFVRRNSKYKLDDKNLEPRLKKLISFI